MAESLADLLYRGPEALDPRIRKARGVFYTPKHVVDYIVQHTVGRMLGSCENPGAAVRLKILDPACGSGCFLVGACQALLEWHRGRRSLDPRHKARIVRSSLFGVDIDGRAIARARSLLRRLTGDKKLKANLSRGNSLMGGGRFNWNSEFPDIMSAGGFDCVIGNPPYVFTRDKGFSQEEKVYFGQNYHHQNCQLNTYALFVEKALALLRPGGVCGLIVPSNWLTVSSMKPFRDFLLASTGELQIVNNRYRVFPDASVDTSIILFAKKEPGRVKLLESSGPSSYQKVASVPARELIGQKVIQIGLYRDKIGRRIIDRMEAGTRSLGEFCRVSTGLKAYQTGKGRPPQTGAQKKTRVFHARATLDSSYRRYLEGKDVCRYRLGWSGCYLSYGDWLAEPRRSVPFEGERLLVRQIPARPPYLVHAAFTDEDYCNDINSMVIHTPKDVSIKYLLGLINSRLVSFWFMKRYDKLQRRIFPQFKVGELRAFPIVPVDSKNREQHDRLVNLVERQLDQGGPDETIDRQIDTLVYSLYGLSRKEIQHIQS